MSQQQQLLTSCRADGGKDGCSLSSSQAECFSRCQNGTQYIDEYVALTVTYLDHNTTCDDL